MQVMKRTPVKAISAKVMNSSSFIFDPLNGYFFYYTIERSEKSFFVVSVDDKSDSRRLGSRSKHPDVEPNSLAIEPK